MLLIDLSLADTADIIDQSLTDKGLPVFVF